MASSDVNFEDDQDYVVCGSCSQNFPLSGLPKFVQHKRFDCDPEHSDPPVKLLICQSCPQSFSTPWSLLQHAQNNHAIRLFIEGGPYNANFTSLQQADASTPTQTEMLAAARRLSQSLMDRNLSELRAPTGAESVIPALALSSTLPLTQTEKSLSSWDPAESGSSGRSSPGPVTSMSNPRPNPVKPCRCPPTNPPCCRPTAIVTHLNDVGVQVGQEVEMECDRTICGCSSQDCGVTILPGTHENMKKCCAEVLPKKRKRHMETKHVPPGLLYRRRKRLSRSNSRIFSPTTDSIFIDVSASTSGATQPYFSVNQRVRGNPAATQTMNSTMTQLHQSVASAIPMGVGSSHHQIDNPQSVLNTSYHPQPDHVAAMLSSKQTNMNAPNGHLNHLSISTASQNHPLPNLASCQPLTASSQTPSREALGQPGPDESVALPNLYTDDFPVPLLDVSSLDMKDSAAELTLQTIDAGQLTEALMHTQREMQAVSESSDLELTTTDPLTGVSGEGHSPPGEGDHNRAKRRRYPTSRPFKCDQCGHGFNQRIHLRKHQSKHTGIKPYKCEQCDYSTVERSHLKVHIRVHTGEKPYKCMYCEYATAQNSTLKIHLKRRHHFSGFTCEHCGKGFGQKSLLETHTHEHQTSVQNTNTG